MKWCFSWLLAGCGASGFHDLQLTGIDGGDVDLVTADVVVSSITLTPCDDSEEPATVALRSSIDLLGNPLPFGIPAEEWCAIDLECDDSPETGLSLSGTLDNVELLGAIACDNPVLEGTFAAADRDLVLVFDFEALLSNLENNGQGIAFPYDSPQSDSLTRDLPDVMFFGSPGDAAVEFGEDWRFSDDSFDDKGERPE